MARNFDLSVRLRTAVEGLQEVQALIGEIQDLGGETERSAARSKALSDELRQLERSQRLIDNFRDLRQEVNRTGDELQDAQQRAQTLGRELASTTNPTKQLQRDFENARRTVTRLKEAQVEQVGALQRSRRELQEAGVSSRRLSASQLEIRQAMGRTSDEIQLLTRHLQRVRDESAKKFQNPAQSLEDGSRRAGKEVDGLGTRLRRLATTAVSSVAAFFGIREAIRGITGIARVGGEFEILEARLESLTGSAENGEKAFAWIQQFAKDTPFQLDQVTDAFVRAKAFGLDPMDGTLQAVADQAAKTGGGMEALNGIITALGQSWSKGRIQAEEMLQLVERGVPAWDLLAQATGKSVGELQRLTTAGKLGREEIRLLIQELGRSGAGAAAEQMNTLQGIVSNLQDTWTQFLNEVNRAGLLEYLKTQIRALADEFERMRQSGELRQWAKRISDSIIGLIEVVKGIVGTLFEYKDAIIATAQAWAVYKAAQASVNLVNFAQTSVNVAAAAMANFGAQTGAATGRLGKLRAGLGAIPGPVKILALATAFLGFDKVLVSVGESIGEFLAKNSEAAKALEETRRRIESQARERLEVLDQERDALEQYRAVQQVNAEEAARMSEEQRKALEEQLRGNEALLQIENIRALNLEQLGVDVQASYDAIREGLQRTRASLQALADASATAGAAIENGISTAAQRLVERFFAMQEGGEKAGEAIKELFAGFDEGNTTAVREIVEAIGAIAEQSVEAGQALNKEIAERLDKMTGNELRRFQIALRAAFDGGTEAASRFAELADRIADAALQNIGTSLQEIRTGISLMESDALSAFATFTESGERSAKEVAAAVGALKDEIRSPEAVNQLRQLLDAWAAQSGEKIDEVDKALQALAENVAGTAEQLSAELSKAIQSAGDEEALNKVRERIATLWNEGKIGADDYTRALAAAQEKQRELAESAKETGDSVAAGMDRAAQSARDLADATTEAGGTAGEVTDRVKGMAASMGAFYDNITARLVALSDKALAAFRTLQGAAATPVGEYDVLTNQIARLDEQISALRRTVDYGHTGITSWFRDTALAAREVEREFLAQQLAVMQLVDQIERGDISSRHLNMNVARLSSTFDLLGDQDLAPLRSALGRIQSEVNSLNDSLNDTIASLRQELAALQGDTVQVEQLRYQEQRLELEEQLQRARDIGDQKAIAAAQEALKLQRQTHELRVQQAREQEQSERDRAAQQAAEDERQRQEQERQQRERELQEYQREERQQQTAQAATSRSQTVDLRLPNGTTASVSGNTDDVNRLLEFLNEAGLRATGR